MSGSSVPLSVQELKKRGEMNTEVDNHKQLRLYLQSCHSLMKQAKMYFSEKNMETAFILCWRFQHLFTINLPKHPQWNSSDVLGYRQQTRALLADCLDILELIKPQLDKKYNDYQVIVKKKEEEERLKKEQLLKEQMEKEQREKEKRERELREKEKREIEQRSIPATSYNQQNLNQQQQKQQDQQQKQQQTVKPLYSYPELFDSQRPLQYTPSTIPPWSPPSIPSKPQNLQSFQDQNYHNNPNNDIYFDTNQPNIQPNNYNPNFNSENGSNFNTNTNLNPPVPQKPQELANSYFSDSSIDPSSSSSSSSSLSNPTSHNTQNFNSDYNESQNQLEDRPFVPKKPDHLRSDNYQPGNSQPNLINDSSSSTNSTTPPQVPSKPEFLSPSKLIDSAREIVIPSNLTTLFMEVVDENTQKNIETCGILCGKILNDKLVINTLLIPKQNGTSDTCNTTNEEELVIYQDQHNLITIGWIHTHPTQRCFMSSVDLHTHCSYQIMLPEAIAIVCSPKYTPNVGIFRLTQPPGLQIISDCREKGFHPHPYSEDELYLDACLHSVITFKDSDFQFKDFRS